jgi:hypothetical protein
VRVLSFCVQEGRFGASRTFLVTGEQKRGKINNIKSI